MKHFSFLLTIIILSLSVEGQRAKVFKYKYRIEENIRIDTASFYVTVNLNSDSTVTFLSAIKDTLVKIPDGLYFCFVNADNQKFYAFLDSNRNCSIKLKGGIYNVTPIGVNIIPIDTVQTLNHSLKTVIRIKVDSTPLPNFFGVYSKRKLSKQKLDEIKTCVDKNRGFDKCENKSLYIFTIEI